MTPSFRREREAGGVASPAARARRQPASSSLSRSRSYQGGPFVEVFSSQGRDPLQNTKVTNKKGVRKIYDKGVRGYVIYSSTSASARLQLPKDDRRALRLSQPYFAVQVFVPSGQAFSVAMNIRDSGNTRRRLHFSTSFSDIKATPLHCQIPLINLIRGKWLNLVLNVADFVRMNFQGAEFQHVDTVEIGGISKIRKIFTLRDEPMRGEGARVPRHLDYPHGVDVETQVLDTSEVRDHDGVRKLREATNQIRPLTEPLVKELEQHGGQHGGRNEKRGGEGPVRIAFGTRFPAPKSTTTSPPKSRRNNLPTNLEISISDERAPSGPTSPVIKLPTVMSPRAKTAHSPSFLDALTGNHLAGPARASREHGPLASRKTGLDRTLPVPAPQRRSLHQDRGAPWPSSSSQQRAPGLRGTAQHDQDDHHGAPPAHPSPPLMQISPPQRQRKTYSKLRYSDHAHADGPQRSGAGAAPSHSQQREVSSRGEAPLAAPESLPQPLEDIPLSRQHTQQGGALGRIEPGHHHHRHSASQGQQDGGFGLDSSQCSNWESLYTDQSMHTPDRPAPTSRITLLPLSGGGCDLFGDPNTMEHGKGSPPFGKQVPTPPSHSKSDSMSSDDSGGASRPPRAARRRVEFREEEIGGAEEEREREREEVVPCSSPRREDPAEDLDYGLFNVSNSFVGQTPELHPCASEDVVLGVDDAGEGLAGPPFPLLSLDPLDHPAAARRREEEAEEEEAPPQRTDSLRLDHTSNRATFDLDQIMATQDPNSSNSCSDLSLVEDLEREDLVEVDEASRRQRDLINRHRIFTPPVIPASKVVVHQQDQASALAVDLSLGRQHAAAEHGNSDEGEDGNAMMDLIYDPILNCYYDAKANRYYELK